MTITKNPITIWFSRTYNNFKIQKQNRAKHLKIGYMCFVRNCSFGHSNTLYDNVSLDGVTLGDFTYIGTETRISNAILGKFCSIGPDTAIGLGKHPTRTFVSTHPIFFSVLGQAQQVVCDRNYFVEFAPINIGNDVWVGARAVVIDGVSIGDGAIVAAGSVVTKNVPPYAIVAGVPAKVVRYRFEPHEVELLLTIKWWDRDFSWIKKNIKSYHNISQFLIAEEPCLSSIASCP